MVEEDIGHLAAALVEDPEDGRALAKLLTALLAAGREAEAVARAERCANAGLSSPSVHAENWLGWYFMNEKKDVPRALDGYVCHAAGSSSGGEGISRMHDVDRMRARVAELKGRQ